MFECAALLGRKRLGGRTMQVTAEIALPITGHPVAQDKVLHPAANIDGIDLYEAMVSNCLADARRRSVQENGPPMETARLQN